MSRKYLTPIQLPADPTAALEAVTKQYADGLVIIDPNDQIATYPQAELWYDTDDPGTNLGSWVSYTPQVDQGATTNIAKTVNYAKYTQIGKTVMCSVSLRMAGSGTTATIFTVSLPVPPVSVSGSQSLGVGSVYDSSAGTRYVCTLAPGTANAVAFESDGVSSNWLGASPSFALASPDDIRFMATYEVA